MLSQGQSSLVWSNGESITIISIAQSLSIRGQWNSKEHDCHRFEALIEFILENAFSNFCSRNHIRKAESDVPTVSLLLSRELELEARDSITVTQEKRLEVSVILENLYIILH